MDARAMLARLRLLAMRPTGRLQCCVAWSGGLDSTVLLHLLVTVRASAPQVLRIRAVHVDHQLQPASADFARHCRRVARQWRVPLAVLRPRIAVKRGESVEERAREARYGALARQLRPGELLLTAQHADDQFETLLLALLRGAGPAGLAAMPEATTFAAGLHLRPLLAHTRAQLEAHAQEHGLEWIDDPSNPEARFDRNFLRLQVVPRLRERWPALATTGARSARHCAQAAAVLAGFARRDAAAAADGDDLAAVMLRRLPPARAAAAVRCWIADQGARMPDERRMGQVLRMLDAREDASPRVGWDDIEVRLSRGRLQLGARRAPSPQPGVSQWCWRDQPALQFAGGARLALRAGARGDIDLARLPERLQVHWHSPREAAAAGQGRRSLRKLFQQLGVAADGRSRLPLVSGCTGDGPARLLAIADLWVDPDVRSDASTRDAGRFVWRPPA